MKIAFYAPYDFRAVGGAERFVLFFCRSLALAGCEVSIFGAHVPEIEGIRCFDVFSGGFSESFDICFTQAIYGFGGLPKADIYVHRYNGTTWGNLLARPHLFLHPRFWWWFFSELRSRHDKDGYIFVSKCAEREMKMLGCRGESIILPGGGGWEIDRFSGGKNNEALRLLFCGRCNDKVKRFDLIQAAFLRARQKMPQISLYVVGGATAQKSKNGIYHTGSLSDLEMRPLLQSCHVQINASFYEGFSLALSEGIFQGGLITLATPVGGNLECLKHGQTGFFFAGEQALSEHIIKLATDDELRNSLLQNIASGHNIRSWEEVGREALDFVTRLGKK